MTEHRVYTNTIQMSMQHTARRSRPIINLRKYHIHKQQIVVTTWHIL